MRWTIPRRGAASKFPVNGKLGGMTPEGVVSARFLLQRDEFTKGQRLAMRALPAGIKWVGWLQCGLLFGLMLVGVLYRPDGNLQPVSFLIFALAWFVLLTSSIVRRQIVNLQFRRMDGRETWYEFDSRGLRCGMPHSESRLDWAEITDVMESATLFVLIPSGGLFYTIPKRALSSNDVSSLQQLFAENVPTSRRRK